MHDNGAVYLPQKLAGCGFAFGNNGVGMVGAIVFDMVDRFLDPVDHTDRDDLVQVLGRPVDLRRGRDSGDRGPRFFVAVRALV